MPSVLYPPARAQAIGEVLDSAFRIFKATLIKCLPYSVLATIAGQLQSIYVIVTGRALRPFSNSDPGYWTVYVLGAIIGTVLINAILLRQATLVSGTPSTWQAALKVALKNAPAVFLMLCLIVLLTGIWFVPLVVIPAAYRWWSALLLSLPAVYLLVSFLCSWPARLLDGKGPVESLRYSVHLVRGNWWRTAMIYLVVLTMILVLSITAALIVGVLTQIVAARDLAVATAVSRVMVVGFSAVYTPLVTSMALAVYGELQARKESADLERRIADAPAG
jgi:hypothetical protein